MILTSPRREQTASGKLSANDFGTSQNSDIATVAAKEKESNPDDVAKVRHQTRASVASIELGSFEKTDAATEMKSQLGVGPDRIAEYTRLRSQAASRIVSATQRLTAALGTVKAAAQLQVLKRSLFECHDLVSDSNLDSSFLSIVTLIEGAIADAKWKSLNAAQLKSIVRAINPGLNQALVPYQDYLGAVREFRSHSIHSGPTFELDLTIADADE